MLTRPDQHVIGTITAIDPASRTITIKEDKAGISYTVLLERTRTLLKVEPGAKDLKTATRIAANDLAIGDRVDIRGFKAGNSANSITAASVILMSARDLQEARQAEMNDWRQRGMAGTVTSVDTAGRKMSINVRTPDGPKPMAVDVPRETQFTRYSPENPKSPVESKLADIRPADQVRILGNRTADGSSITAEKIYSGSFRTVAGTISSISPNSDGITVTDLQTKQPVQVVLTAESAIRKLPQPLAMMLAKRLNPNFRSNESTANAPAGTPAAGAKAGESAGGDISRRPIGSADQPGGAGASSGSNNKIAAASGGDVSQMIERLPKIAVSDLKSGDAVVVSGAAGSDKSQIAATNVIAGVEPIFQSAPSRQGRSLGGDWSLDMAIPAQ